MLDVKNTNTELFWEIFSKQDRLKIDEFQKYMDKFAVNFNLYKDGNRVININSIDELNMFLQNASLNALDIIIPDYAIEKVHS